MSRLIVNVGTSPNDNTGDKLRDAFIKINTNFEELYSSNLYNYKISLDSSQVANLGTPITLIPSVGSDIYIHIVTAYVKINVITPLVVPMNPTTHGLEDLHISNGTFPNILSLDSSKITCTGTSIFSFMPPTFLISIEQILGGNQPITTFLDGLMNPTSGEASMDFFLTYQLFSF